MASELTLDAALRDALSEDPSSRNQAVRNLAPALLEQTTHRSPAWRAAREHPRGPEVLARLRAALGEEEEAPIRGLALVGLAQLGEEELLEYAQLWVQAEDPVQDAPDISGGAAGRAGANAFLRECSVIALGLLGDAAKGSAQSGGEHADDEWSVANRCRDLLSSSLRSEHADVRFQACIALAELGGESAQGAIVDAFRVETLDEVRANQVAALSVFDPPSEASCQVLREFLDSAMGSAPPKQGDARAVATYNAALALAAARDRGAQRRLIASISQTDERDRALEALAALGPPIDDSALRVIRNLANSRLSPGMTRVRAAYAMCTLEPKEGLALLAKLERSWRPAVREAVADARIALELLERREAEDGL
jgi:hypothetical protein